MSHKNKAEQLVEDYGMGKITKAEFIHEIVAEPKLTVVYALLDAWDWSRKAGVQMEHSADHSNM